MYITRLPAAVREAAAAYGLVVLLCVLTVCNVITSRLAGGFGRLVVGSITALVVVIAVIAFFYHRRDRVPVGPRSGWRLQQFLTTFAPAMVVYGLAMFTQRRTPIWTVLGVPGASSGTSGDTIFLDLAHLVDAASCPLRVSPGEVVCDRLDRTFNQNPLWVEATRPLLRGIDLQILGMMLGACFIAAVALLTISRPSAHLLAIPMLFSPSIALGIERGQPDLFIWMLATPGLILLSRSTVGWNSLGVLLLAVATVLKVFPILLLLPFLVLPGRGRRLLSASGVVATCVYWIALHNTLLKMLGSTQRGQSLSYGLATILPDVLASTREQVLAVVILTGVLTAGVLLVRKAALIQGASGSAVAAAFSCFYLGSFLAGANWSYRLIFALALVGQLRLPTQPVAPPRLDGLLVLTVVPLLWLTPVPAAGIWQLLVAVVTTAVMLVVVLSLLPTQRTAAFRMVLEPAHDGQ